MKTYFPLLTLACLVVTICLPASGNIGRAGKTAQHRQAKRAAAHLPPVITRLDPDHWTYTEDFTSTPRARRNEIPSL